MNKPMTPREYLQAIRETGMTQAEIASRTGITQGTISKLERGDVEDVYSKTYVALQTLYAELKLWKKGERRSNPCSAPKAGE
jgi:transcriptional regulator with XRE-family HTH domain